MLNSIVERIGGSEAFLGAAMGVAALLWRQWIQPAINEWTAGSRWEREFATLQTIAAGVVKAVYEDIVRARKRESDGGRALTQEERKNIAFHARQMLIEAARAQGLDIMAMLGQAGADALIEWAVQKAKGDAAERQPTGRFASEEFARILDRRNVPAGHSVAADMLPLEETDGAV